MDNLNYNFVTSQIGTFNNVTSISNNIANANTIGYKEDIMVFEKYLTEDLHDKNTMPLDKTTIIDTKIGSMKSTGRELDFAISGNAFFVLNTPLGERYTKSGNFLIDSEYRLVNSKGYPVLDENGNVIMFNDQDRMIMIDAQGTVYARDKAENNYDVRGVLGIVQFSNERALRKTGDGNFIIEENTNTTVMQADPSTYQMMQGYLEESNVTPISSMTNLVSLQHQSAEMVNLIGQMENTNSHLNKVLSKVDK